MTMCLQNGTEGIDRSLVAQQTAGIRICFDKGFGHFQVFFGLLQETRAR